MGCIVIRLRTWINHWCLKNNNLIFKYKTGLFMENSNKRIAINTIIIYLKMIIMAFISFFVTRYVLIALGVSDYGLYNVVGGVVTMLNFISIAMMTTTRRYVNVEMGRGIKGNVNKVFNVCLVLHIGFAIFIYLIAMSIGLWYINNVLNVTPEKMADARFVYIISTSVSALGIINVPYQALLAAYERFLQIAIIDIISSCLKIPLVIALLLYTGNNLRFYASGICVVTFFSLLLYSSYCYREFKNVIKWHFYREKQLYKKILLFNNYTSLGAFAYLGRSQGSTMVINYFFGTIVNGAYAIAIQIESQINGLVSNLVTAANPQMTQSYSAGDFQRSFDIVCKITRFSALVMAILTFSLYIGLTPLLSIWLKVIPDGTIIFCQVMLISLFLRSLGSGIDPLIQATGQVKWYQICQSSLLILGIPLSILFFIWGMSPVYIIVAFIICDIIRTIAMFIIICRITPFDFKKYAVSTYVPLIKVLIGLGVYDVFYQFFPLYSLSLQLIGFFMTLIASIIVCMSWGMTSNERSKTVGKLLKHVNIY